MSIEKYLPDKGSRRRLSLFDRIKNSLVHVDKGPVNREFYNSNQTRKFIFTEWRGADNFRQLNIGLEIKVGESWSGAMWVMTRWSDKQEQIYGLELMALTDNLPMPWENVYYDQNTGGQKRKTGKFEWPSREQTVDEERQIAESLGFIKANQLPEFIDFERTAKEFMLQAKRMDFSNPVLYPKELIK